MINNFLFEKTEKTDECVNDSSGLEKMKHFLEQESEERKDSLEGNPILEKSSLDEVDESSELSEEFMERIPMERRDTIEKAYENSEASLIDFIEKNQEQLTVGNAGFTEGSYYYKNKVYMERNLGDEEYAEVFQHELSHYLDEQQGWYSEQLDYLNAVYDDTMIYESDTAESRKAKDAMLDELFDSDVCYNRHVSDILSATSRNDPKVILRYNMEGVSYFHHKNSYFEKGHNRENEIYADMMACISENDPETLQFLEKHFPKTYEATRKSFEKEEEEV